MRTTPRKSAPLRALSWAATLAIAAALSACQKQEEPKSIAEQAAEVQNAAEEKVTAAAKEAEETATKAMEQVDEAAKTTAEKARQAGEAITDKVLSEPEPLAPGEDSATQ